MALSSESLNEIYTKLFASPVIPVSSLILVEKYSIENLRFSEY